MVVLWPKKLGITIVHVENMVLSVQHGITIVHVWKQGINVVCPKKKRKKDVGTMT